KRVNGAAEWSARADKCRRQVGEHLGTIKRKSLRAEVERAGGVKHVHTHVITVGPDTQLRIVKEVQAKVKAIASIGAGGVCRRGNGDAFVGDRSGACEAGKLRDQPAVRDVIVEHDWVAGATELAGPAETAPNRRNAVRSQKRTAGGFVKNLKALVHYLNVLGLANGSIRIGGRAIAAHARKRNTVEVEDGGGHVWCEQIERGDVALLDDRVRRVVV